jgi:xanthine dehydrogenase iron-sulfur cluster and FAD-binding subunit A
MATTWQTFLRPSTLDEALTLLAEHAGSARLIAGGTDVIVELSRGVLPTETLIDLTNVASLKYVRDEGDTILLGALATHNDVIASRACVARALPLAQACWEVGAPQIRTCATIAGNLVTASPANDTIAPLIALDASLVLASLAGERVVPLRDFYQGVRRTVLQPGEIVREIRIPALRPDQRGLFLKLGLRRAQAISVIDAAIVLTLDGEIVTDARITLGCLAPTIVRATTVEDFLRGKRLDPDVRERAGLLARQDARPIDDIRGSAAYRLSTLSTLISEGLRRLAEDAHAANWPTRPLLLDTTETEKPAGTADLLARSATERASIPAGMANAPARPNATRSANAAETATSIGSPRAPESENPAETATADEAALKPPPRNAAEMAISLGSSPARETEKAAETATPIGSFAGVIETTINGQPYALPGAQGKTLLNMLREDAGLTGAKEGCAEGECGACTVWLDGRAVMSCMVPAAQAHGAAVTTIEGLAAMRPGAADDDLHPLQRAFVACGAVQCGFCIPGMLMAGAKLLDERPAPTIEEIQVALSGNICRCTGYRKILDAVLLAGGSHDASD